MMKTLDIMIPENAIFTYSYDDNCISVWLHRDGKQDGPVVGPVMHITFEDYDVSKGFHEMMELLCEKIYNKEDEDG